LFFIFPVKIHVSTYYNFPSIWWTCLFTFHVIQGHLWWSFKVFFLFDSVFALILFLKLVFCGYQSLV
jgi:hypothetical protein